MTYKIMNKLDPENLWDKFELTSTHSRFATRSCRDLQILRLYKEHAKRALNIRLWKCGMYCCIAFDFTFVFIRLYIGIIRC